MGTCPERIYADFGENAITLAFERTEQDAGNVKRSYEIFVEGFDVDAEGLIGEDGNVAYIWDKEPTDEEREAVEGCFSHDS